MTKKIAQRIMLRTLLLTAALVMPVVMLMASVSEGYAQEQFFTQSGGRGLQNAKTNARLSKVEGDVDSLNTEMAKVKPHAKAELGSCPDAGDKLRYTGTNWVCERETDPTVQGWAKKALPGCSGGSILGVVGGEFSCVQSGFLSNETDPTVQAFAKSPLPGCGADQVLKVSNGVLGCATDQVGLNRETDPTVHDFASKTLNPSLPNCSTNEMLTMMGGHLSCRVDSVGITQEVDPMVSDFARKDISGYTLAACASGELLQAYTDSTTSKVLLKCVDGAATVGSALKLGDLKDVDTTAQVSNSILVFNGTKWVAGSETDPTVPAWAKDNVSNCAAGEVLTFNGNKLTCVVDAGGSASPLKFAGLDDVNVTGVTDGKFVKYDATSQKWIPGTVEEFAQTTLPTCSTGEVLSGDGTNLTCVNDAGGSSDPLDLVELGDVRTSSSANLAPADKDFLRYDTATSKWIAVHDKLSAAQTTNGWCYYDGTDVKCDRGAPAECTTGEVLSWDGTNHKFICSAANTALGLGDMSLQNSSTVVIHGGTINGTTIGGTDPKDGTFTNIRITGNLYVSGSQSIDGVSFANGGLAATGTVTATAFVGDGSGITNVSLGAITAPGNTGDILFKGNTGKISATALMNWDETAHNVKVGGTVQVAGSGAEACDAASSGKMRVVDVGGGDFRMQFCRQ